MVHTIAKQSHNEGGRTAWLREAVAFFFPAFPCTDFMQPISSHYDNGAAHWTMRIQWTYRVSIRSQVQCRSRSVHIAKMCSIHIRNVRDCETVGSEEIASGRIKDNLPCVLCCAPFHGARFVMIFLFCPRIISTFMHARFKPVFSLPAQCVFSSFSAANCISARASLCNLPRHILSFFFSVSCFVYRCSSSAERLFCE